MSLPVPPDGTASLELLGRLRAGDASAFDVLYRRHRDEILLAVRAGMGPALRAAMQSEDVLQSIAIEAFAVLQRREPPAHDFTTLLRRIVRHRLIDRARAVRRRHDHAAIATTDVDALAAPGPPSYADPRYERIERALLAMPAELRDVIRWRQFEGLTSQQVARRTGRSDAAVRQLFARAMARLSLLVQGEA